MVGFVAGPKASEFGGPLGGAFRCSPLTYLEVIESVVDLLAGRSGWLIQQLT
jgi:hypothetical protein